MTAYDCTHEGGADPAPSRVAPQAEKELSDLSQRKQLWDRPFSVPENDRGGIAPKEGSLANKSQALLQDFSEKKDGHG